MIYICKEGHHIKRHTGSHQILHETRCGHCAKRVAVHLAPPDEQDANYMERGGTRLNLERWNAVRAKMRAALTSVLGGRSKSNPVSCVTGAARIADCTASLNFFPALRRGVLAAFQPHELAEVVQFDPTQPRGDDYI